MVKIRLKRKGRKKKPLYRIVIIEDSNQRDGKTIEDVGTYNPQSSARERELDLKMDRIDHWLQVGAQPTDTAKSLIRQGRLSPEDWLERAEKKTKAKADRKNNKKPALEASAVDQEEAKTEDSEPEAKSEEADAKEPEAEVKEEQHFMELDHEVYQCSAKVKIKFGYSGDARRQASTVKFMKERLKVVPKFLILFRIYEKVGMKDVFQFRHETTNIDDLITEINKLEIKTKEICQNRANTSSGKAIRVS